MGANAQTSVPTFTAGEVLTAANMNISARTGVPVFSNTTTRDAGFGGTGEKTLAEGQLCYLEDSNVVQYYDGAAWATVGPTTVSSGLTVVKAKTAFTSASSFTADNVFTSTYDNYRMVVYWSTGGTTDATLQLRVGGSAAATNYNRQRIFAQSTSVTGSRASSQTSLNLMAAYASVSGLIVEIQAPALASATNFFSMATNGDNGLLTSPNYEHIMGNHSTATAYDGLALSFGTSTGWYIIYGYSN